MLSFQDLGFFVLNLTLRLRPEGVTRILSLSLSLSAFYFNAACAELLWVMVIVNKKPLQNTTSSVISVLLLIYGLLNPQRLTS